MHGRINTGAVLIAAGLLLICAALGLTGYNYLSDKRAENFSEETVEQLEDIIGANADEQPAVPVLGGTQAEIPDYVLNPDMDMPEAKLDDSVYIGILQIPELGLELPVMGKLSYPNLRKAPCRYKGSVYKNDLIIAAHNYQAHFGKLKNIALDSTVIFQDTDGNEFRYTVSDMETLNGYAIDQMDAGDWDLTLFTCTIGGKTRVTVRCKLQELTVGAEQ